MPNVQIEPTLGLIENEAGVPTLACLCFGQPVNCLLLTSEQACSLGAKLYAEGMALKGAAEREKLREKGRNKKTRRWLDAEAS